MHKKCFHKDVVQTILGDALSGKSFDEISRSFLDFRTKEYLEKKLSYLSSIKFWCLKKKVNTVYFILFFILFYFIFSKKLYLIFIFNLLFI